MMKEFILAADIGKQNDFTALSVIEKEGDKIILRGLSRFRHVRYGNVVSRICEVYEKLHKEGNVCLVVDATGVGTVVCDALEEQDLPVHRLTITGGHNAKTDGFILSVPKEKLVYNAQVVIENQNIVIPSKLGEKWKEARSEFSNFAMKLTASGENLTYEALRSSQHDDTVLSILLALWMTTQEEEVPICAPIVVGRKPREFNNEGGSGGLPSGIYHNSDGRLVRDHNPF